MFDSRLPFGLMSRRLPWLPLVFLAPAVLHAQGSGSLRGTVTTSDHALAGARVSIEAPGRVAITDEKGKYHLRNIPAGHYDVQVAALGYTPQRKGVVVAAGQTAGLDVSLERGSLLLSSVIVSATRTPVEANKVAT